MTYVPVCDKTRYVTNVQLANCVLSTTVARRPMSTHLKNEVASDEENVDDRVLVNCFDLNDECYCVVNQFDKNDVAIEEQMKASFLTSISKAARKRASANDLLESNEILNAEPEVALSDDSDSRQVSYQRIQVTSTGEEVDKETKEVCSLLTRAIKLREKWIKINEQPNEYWGSLKMEEYQVPAKQVRAPSDIPMGSQREDPKYDVFSSEIPSPSNHTLKMIDGVIHVYEENKTTPIYAPYTQPEFYRDFFEICRIVNHGPVKTLSFKRLRLLESRFGLHILLNADRENMQQKSVPHRDFYNIRKVDTHVHHSACMNQKHLLRFIKSKLKKYPGEVVIFRDGKFMTLSEVFTSLHLTANDLSVDTLDMHASNTFHRFDRFNLKYNPAGQSRLREIFLKTDNFIAGRYLAEVTKEVMSDFQANKYQLAEWRVSIYGRKHSEWDKLARWFHVNRLASPHIRWMIQVPRLYFIYRRSGEVENFQDMIDNIFMPLFEVTQNPESNPSLHLFLNTLVGFDCVDDESKPEPERAGPGKTLPPPAEWTSLTNPPYDYYCYYLYANLATLNHFRKSKGLSTFQFRPHCGEAGDIDHLATAFLLANQINHGITLRKAVGLQYLYYLTQIGIAMSPLSNNRLFLDYHRNPFPVYHARGLNVSLSSDDPLMLHYTKDPLVEEYSVAAQVWKLSSADICEIARNSVLQSGFEHPFKAHFLGTKYYLRGVKGNDITMSNVPDIRIRYRHETLHEELNFVANSGRDS